MDKVHSMSPPPMGMEHAKHEKDRRDVASDEARHFSGAAHHKKDNASGEPRTDPETLQASEAGKSENQETLEAMLIKARRDLRQTMGRNMQEAAKDISRDYENS